MERDENFYEGEPCIIEIEKRLNHVQKYLSEGNIKKAQGGIKGLWHAVTELADKVREYLESAEKEASIVSDEIRKDDYWYSPYTAETAIDETLNVIRELSPIFETRGKTKHDEIYSYENLSKAWKYVQEKILKEERKMYKEMGLNEREADMDLGYILTHLPYDTKVDYPVVENICINIPIRENREQRDQFAANKDRLKKYLSEYFKRPVTIYTEYLYNTN